MGGLMVGWQIHIEIAFRGVTERIAFENLALVSVDDILPWSLMQGW